MRPLPKKTVKKENVIIATRKKASEKKGFMRAHRDRLSAEAQMTCAKIFDGDQLRGNVYLGKYIYYAR